MARSPAGYGGRPAPPVRGGERYPTPSSYPQQPAQDYKLRSNTITANTRATADRRHSCPFNASHSLTLTSQNHAVLTFLQWQAQLSACLDFGSHTFNELIV